jgi:ferredoxin
MTLPGFILASAGEGAGSSIGLDFKLFHEPLLPIAGTAVDLTPFLLMFAMLTAASIFLRIERGPEWVSAVAKSVAAGVWALTVYLLGRGLVDLERPTAIGNFVSVGILSTFTGAYVAHMFATQGVRQSFRLASQSLSFGAFVLSIHPCACMVRDAIYGISYLNSDNMRAFEFLIVIVTVAAFTMLWGRAFCGWVCPIGFVQELATRLTSWTRAVFHPDNVRLWKWGACLTVLGALVYTYVTLGPARLPFYEGLLVFWAAGLLVLTLMVLNNPRLERRLWPVRYASLGLFAGTIAVGVYLNGVFCVLLKSILESQTVVLFATVAITTLLLSQAWCRFLCPEGALLGLLTKLSGWKVVLDKGKCIACNVCKESCPVEAIEIGRVVEPVCLYCGKCLDHCPTDALTMGREFPATMIPLPLAAAK